MSTFDGLVEEFPDICIDYFRRHPDKRQPAACFLSHVHSDHLLGLETLKMPFVYCSAATRRLLLRMEKYPHRINFSKGTLEARKQTYKHLKSILRPLPLQTPVELELRPGHHIRVTLFDANHCPGAVMFLIEGSERAILYTGDVRAEPWWVSSIVRNPVMLPYTNGRKRLDCMYLDTTFASHHDIHKEFPTKAEGLAELLEKLNKCPADSVFYFRAWTLGYEDVWIAMSRFLKSRIHVDQYQLRLFRAISEDGLNAEPGPALIGFQVGNEEQPGCLTADPTVKIHSCEPGTPCHAAILKSKNIIWVTPIISRMPNGSEVLEVGAGGGRGDLYHSREIDVGNESMVQALQLLISSLADNQDIATKITSLVDAAREQQDHRIILEDVGADPESELTLPELSKLMVSSYEKLQRRLDPPQKPLRRQRLATIHFPYSRHSSYSELRGLVQAFRPIDICPCTVDIGSWTEDHSIKSLFGDLCSGSVFRYDNIIRQEVQQRQKDSGTTAEEAISQPQDTQQTNVASTQSEDGFDEPTDVQGVALEKLIAVEETTQGVAEEAAVVSKVREAWLNANDGSTEHRNRVLTAQLLDADDGSVSTQTESIAEADEEDSDADTKMSEISDDLDDLPYGESISSWYSAGSKQLENEAPSGRMEAERPPQLASQHEHIDMDRRRQAYVAARVCLAGDATQWNNLYLHSIHHRHRKSSSPEI